MSVAKTMADITLGVIKGHPTLSTLSIISTFITPLQDVLVPHLIGRLINELKNNSSSLAVRNPQIRKSFFTLAVAVGVLQVLFVGTDVVEAHLFPAIIAYVRKRMLTCLFRKHDASLTGELSTGEIITQFVKVPWTVTNWFEVTKSTLPQVLVMIIATAYLGWLDLRLGALGLGMIVATGFAFYQTIHSCISVSEARDRALNTVQERIDDLLRNMQAVYAADQTRQEQAELRELEVVGDKLYVRTMMCSSWVKTWLVPFTLVSIGLVIWRCLTLMKQDRLSVGLFVSVLAISLYMLSAIMRIVQYGRTVVYYLGILRSLAEGWCEGEKTKESDAQAPPPHMASSPAAGSASPAVVSLRGVSYVYEDAASPAIVDVDLDVREGENIAIVGSIGGGKTTIVKLIMNLIEPTTGVLLLRGVPYTQIGTEGVRRTFGYVPQSAPLFDRTVLQNIAYGIQPPPSERQAWEAASSLGLDRIVAKLGNGMQTRCGKGGAKLSGGQRQAVWLIRMRLRGARVLVLDEPTSAMDADTRDIVSKALAEGFETTIFVTHDAELVKTLATRVVVIDQGRLIEAPAHRGDGPYSSDRYPEPISQIRRAPMMNLERP